MQLIYTHFLCVKLNWKPRKQIWNKIAAKKKEWCGHLVTHTVSLTLYVFSKNSDNSHCDHKTQHRRTTKLFIKPQQNKSFSKKNEKKLYSSNEDLNLDKKNKPFAYDLDIYWLVYMFNSLFSACCTRKFDANHIKATSTQKHTSKHTRKKKSIYNSNDK